jgi:mono/diheme cytochrome c family protein
MSNRPSISGNSTIRRVLIVVACYLGIAAAVATTSGWKEHHVMVDADKPTDNAVLGKQIWQRENCTVCHSIYGLGGHIGPDLTNLSSKKGNDYTRAMILHGNGKMPAFYLNDSEIDALCAYFHYIDQLGTYPLDSGIEHPFGISK